MKMFIAAASCTVLAYLALWTNKEPNIMPSYNTILHIATNQHKTIRIESMGNSFEVNYIKNVAKNGLNPEFPAIHIQTDTTHNAWLHIVRTDSTETHYQLFVDTCQNPEIYPYYTRDQDFTDAPYWRYKLWYKPVSFWDGHAYAVQINELAKTISCIGGIGWGFRLSYFKLHPTMILPYQLTNKNWQTDWTVFNSALTGYTNLETI